MLFMLNKLYFILFPQPLGLISLLAIALKTADRPVPHHLNLLQVQRYLPEVTPEKDCFLLSFQFAKLVWN